MGECLGVSQSAISKLEAGTDEELSLRVLREYCRATDQRIGMLIGKQYSHVEAVTKLFDGLRYHLTALSELPQGDGEIQKAVQEFFGQSLFNFLKIFEKLHQTCPDHANYEIRIEMQEIPLQKACALPTLARASEKTGARVLA
jgi:hypothetical protein